MYKLLEYIFKTKGVSLSRIYSIIKRELIDKEILIEKELELKLITSALLAR
jgi:hypothetical protein